LPGLSEPPSPPRRPRPGQQRHQPAPLIHLRVEPGAEIANRFVPIGQLFAQQCDLAPFDARCASVAKVLRIVPLPVRLTIRM